ncbi:MAG: metallophosphoesterase, partial [bacterium]|nr:metallophosphoesterase [bacterium]
MPIVIPCISRRSFLSTTTVAGLACVAGLNGQAREKKGQTRWAFLSDTHVPADPNNEYRGFKPYDRMKDTVAQVLQTKPEGTLITGDLARLEGFKEDYQNFSQFLVPLREHMPIGLCLGNHDDRANLLEILPAPAGEAQPVNKKLVTLIDASPVRFILLDSNFMTNITTGLIGKAQREWLKSYLIQADDTPLFLFLHHTFGDGDGDLVDAQRFFEIILPHKQVKAVFYGHSHVYRYDMLEDLALINLPSTAYNFRDTDPVGWV